MAKARVVIFSLSSCPHCQRAKSLLHDNGVEYVEISLADYPEKRNDMLQLADRLTVPQIFVNGHHIGGASELMALQESQHLTPLLQHPPPEDAGGRCAVDDPRLQKPDYAPRPQQPACEAPEEPLMCIGSERHKYAEVVEMLANGVHSADRSYYLGCSKYRQCFVASDLMTFLLEQFKLPSREDATQEARKLQRANVFFSAEGVPGDICDNAGLYRLQVHEVGMWRALNIGRIWCSEHQGCIGEEQQPMGLLFRLKRQLSEAIAPHTDQEGKVDYLALSSSFAFKEFELASCELQRVDIPGLQPTALRTAFVINLYNTVVPHAFAREGIPTDDLARVAFFGGAMYKLGEATYSLNELENGVLRGNRAPPYHLRVPFKAGDYRLRAIEVCDHRIHFALNCGAKSCPPVKWFTPESLDEELRVVAMAWVEQDENVRVDVASKTLWLSEICSWYSADFGSDNKAIGQTLLAHTRGKQRDELQLLLAGSFTIKHPTYDWSTNSAKARDFTQWNLKSFVS